MKEENFRSMKTNSTVSYTPLFRRNSKGWRLEGKLSTSTKSPGKRPVLKKTHDNTLEHRQSEQIKAPSAGRGGGEHVTSKKKKEKDKPDVRRQQLWIPNNPGVPSQFGGKII